MSPVHATDDEAAGHEIIFSHKLLHLEMEVREGGKHPRDELSLRRRPDNVRVGIVADVIGPQQSFGSVQILRVPGLRHRWMIALFPPRTYATP